MLALAVLSFRGNATGSLVKDVGKDVSKDVGRGEPAAGDSARRQLRSSGVTFHVFSAHTDNTGSVWLGREAPDNQLTGFTEISPVGGISYGSGGTSTNQATFENSHYATLGEPSGDPVCEGGRVFWEGNSWATAQDDDHFGVVLYDTGGSGCSSTDTFTTPKKLSSAEHCAFMFVYVAEIDPALAAGRGVTTLFRKVGDTQVVGLHYMLGTDGFNAGTGIDMTDCGASHAYEFITLKEADDHSEWSSEDWDAAVPKSIHPKLTTSLAPNTSPLFVLHGKYDDPSRPITLSCQGCIPSAPQEEVPSAPQEEVPSAPQEEVPPAPQEEVPSAPQEEVPSAPQEEVSSFWEKMGKAIGACALLGLSAWIRTWIRNQCCNSRQATPSMLQMPIVDATDAVMPAATTGAMPPCGACETADHSLLTSPSSSTLRLAPDPA